MNKESRKFVKGIFNKSLKERVKIDIRLHNLTIKEYEKSIKYYIKANVVKNKLIDILDGKITNLKQIRKSIKELKMSRRTHLYCRKDKDWNKVWIKVYNDWIIYLNNLLLQKRNE